MRDGGSVAALDGIFAASGMINVYCVTGDIQYYIPRIIAASFSKYSGKTLVLCSSSSEVEMLDRGLWVYSSDVFLPHGTTADPLWSRHPIVLSDYVPDECVFDLYVLLDGAPDLEWESSKMYVRITSMAPQDVSGFFPEDLEKRCFVEKDKKWKEFVL